MNVLGDSYGAAIINHLLRYDLKAIDRDRVETEEDDTKMVVSNPKISTATETSFITEDNGNNNPHA